MRKAKSTARKLSHDDADLLRAAVVFAGAGLDAVLKQLVVDALYIVIDTHESARRKFSSYGASLVTEQPGLAKEVLGNLHPDQRMREAYTAHLTRGSLQSEGDLMAVRDALGISPTGAFEDGEIKSHGHFFKARNQIVHELDLKKPGGRGDYTRRTRSMAECRSQANDALQLAAAYVITVDKGLAQGGASRLHP